MNMMMESKLHRLRRRDAREARLGQLNDDRFASLVARIVVVMRQSLENRETSSIFGLEGPLRAAIRSDLCRRGWRWYAADDTARALLHQALLNLRAERPNWEEGQASWAINDDALITRTICVNCGCQLPDGHFKFCGDICASAHHHVLQKVKSATEGEAYDKVVKLYRRRYGN